jgi:soluble lytic murein transglycosylase-like protein
LTGEQVAGFAEVVYSGRRGWAFSTYLEDGDEGRGAAGAPANPGGLAPPAPGSGTAVVTADLYLRSAASFSSQVRTTMPAGAVVNLTGAAQNGYVLVLYNGARGWASATYLLTAGRPNDEYNYPQALIERFIVDAARRYGQDPDAMLRVARCESNLNAQAVNPAGSYGLYQFVRATWESTPFADHDVFEAWANANAAAWMWAVGRRHEWVCR